MHCVAWLIGCLHQHRHHMWNCHVMSGPSPGLLFSSSFMTALLHIHCYSTWLYFKLYAFISCIYVCVGAQTYHSAWVEVSFQKSVLSFYHVGSGARTQVTRLGGRYIYPLSPHQPPWLHFKESFSFMEQEYTSVATSFIVKCLIICFVNYSGNKGSIF